MENEYISAKVCDLSCPGFIFCANLKSRHFLAALFQKLFLLLPFFRIFAPCSIKFGLKMYHDILLYAFKKLNTLDENLIFSKTKEDNCREKFVIYGNQLCDCRHVIIFFTNCTIMILNPKSLMLP